MVSCHGNGVAASAEDGAPGVLPPPASASGSCCPTRHRACLWDLRRPASYSSTGLGAKWAEVCQRGLPGQLLLASGPRTAVGAHTGVRETSLRGLLWTWWLCSGSLRRLEGSGGSPGATGRAPMFHTRGVSGCKRAFPGSGTVSFSATHVPPFWGSAAS